MVVILLANATIRTAPSGQHGISPILPAALFPGKTYHLFATVKTLLLYNLSSIIKYKRDCEILTGASEYAGIYRC
jgi:hypothetical protein